MADEIVINVKDLLKRVVFKTPPLLREQVFVLDGWGKQDAKNTLQEWRVEQRKNDKRLANNIANKVWRDAHRQHCIDVTRAWMEHNRESVNARARERYHREKKERCLRNAIGTI